MRPPHVCFQSCLCVCVLPKHRCHSIRQIFARHSALMSFWNRDKHFRFWGQRVKVEGHCAIKCAGYNTLQSEAYSTHTEFRVSILLK